MHWINYGIHENRICTEILNLNNNNNMTINNNIIEKETFDWEYYIKNNNDLTHICNKDDAWDHWINYGKNENRKCYNILKEKTDFDWEYYIKNNNDLTHICNKDDAWDHWINHGKNENRICLFNKIEKEIEIEKEKEKNIQNEMNDIIFKKNNMDWIQYIYDNPDLKIFDKDSVWHHWILHGHREKRQIKLINKENQQLVINNTEIHNGRFGNLFFVNMCLHFMALKFNLKCSYKYFNKFNEMGIYLHIGDNEYPTNIVLNEYIFLDVIQSINLEKQNIIINNENWFQTKNFAEYLKNYFNIPYYKNKIINNNIFKKRYNNNNDVFIHIRLGDIENRISNIEEYYETALNNVIFVNGYVASDDINHPICKNLIKKYNLIEINKTEVETIMFATTCNYIVLSGGTFSWLIGFFAFFSKTIYYPYIENRWYGDIFNFSNWTPIYF
jgi:hypothetical protein